MGFFEFLFGLEEPTPTSKYNDGVTMYDDSYFKNNDEDRAICEEMFSDHYHNPDMNLEEHYGWENKLNYDTDGYADEEYDD